MKRGNDLIVCAVCGVEFNRKDVQQHYNTKQHIEAHKKIKGVSKCKDCGVEYVKNYWKEHVKEEPHQEAIAKKQELKERCENDELVCKFCNEKYIRKNFQEHKRTEKHREAQKQMYGNCVVCKERYVKKYWKEHVKSETHKMFERKLQNRKAEKSSQRREERQKYKIRQGSEENWQYINTLASFLLLRYVFKSKENFKFSINNDEWNQFGDVVIEVGGRIEAICCKKIQSRNSYPMLVLSAESGNLSVKEKYDVFDSLKAKKDISKVSFGLHTISNILIDGSSEFMYDDETLSNWNPLQKKTWQGRTVKIKQHKGEKRKDLLNTTDDSEDIFTVKVVESGGANCSDSNLRMYINQKQVEEMKSSIQSILEDKFGTAKDIPDLLVKHVRAFFNTDKFTNKEHNFKMTREDVLIKIAELFLAPHLLVPNGIIEEKEEIGSKLDLWNMTIHNFDFVIVKNDCDVIRKLYSSINHVQKTKTELNKVSTLWRTGLIPLLLTVSDEHQLTVVLKVLAFLKTELATCFKFIIVSDVKVGRGFFPEDLNGFVCGEDLRLLDFKDFQDVLQAPRVGFLDFDVPLNEIVSCNADFLEKLTPDALLNIFLGDYSFKDDQVPGKEGTIEESIEETLVLEEETVTKGLKYFKVKDYETVKGTESLLYLVNVGGKSVCVRVPPEL